MTTTLPLVIHVPHASMAIPADVRDQFVITDLELDHELIVMTDLATDELFACPSAIANTVVFPVSRLVVDPERFIDDENEVMAQRGMGVVYTATSGGQPLRSPLTDPARQELLGRFYGPHHQALEMAVQAVIEDHGRCLIVDAHSFPSRPIPCDLDQTPHRPAMCIGTDSFHTGQALVDAAVSFLSARHWKTYVDAPYRGTIVPQRWYQHDARVQSLMIEVNRGLYMDQETGTLRRGDVNSLAASLRELMEMLAMLTVPVDPPSSRGNSLMPEPVTNSPLLTHRFQRAFALACEIHEHQLRKGTTIPYIAHVMSVSALVLEHGGSEDAATAGLLHDTVEDSEDGAATQARIRRAFGDRVGDIVMGCSDAVAVPGKGKPDWLERKQSYLSHLRAETNPEVLLVSACDKLHNARAIASDLRTLGDKVWSRFKVGRDGQLWYYESLVEIHREKTPRGSDADKERGIVVDDLARVVADIRRLSA